MTQQPSFIEDFKTALDFFLRRRPPLQALMWHTENIAANGSFVVPQGKVYEVFFRDELGDQMCLNGIPVDFPALALAYSGWRPANFTIAAYFDGVGETAYYAATMSLPLILSENDILQPWSLGAFVVRWRDVTHRQ